MRTPGILDDEEMRRRAAMGLLGPEPPMPPLMGQPSFPTRQPDAMTVPTGPAPRQSIWDRIKTGAGSLLGVPQDGLLSPEDRGAATNSGLMAAGISLLGNSGYRTERDRLSLSEALGGALQAGQEGAMAGVGKQDALKQRQGAVAQQEARLKFQQKYLGADTTDRKVLQNMLRESVALGLKDESTRLATVLSAMGTENQPTRGNPTVLKGRGGKQYSLSRGPDGTVQIEDLPDTDPEAAPRVPMITGPDGRRRPDVEGAAIQEERRAPSAAEVAAQDQMPLIEESYNALEEIEAKDPRIGNRVIAKANQARQFSVGRVGAGIVGKLSGTRSDEDQKALTEQAIINSLTPEEARWYAASKGYLSGVLPALGGKSLTINEIISHGSPMFATGEESDESLAQKRAARRARYDATRRRAGVPEKPPQRQEPSGQGARPKYQRPK